MKPLFLLLLPLPWALASGVEPAHPPQTAQTLTLQTATRLALSDSPSIHAAQARWKTAQTRIPQAGAWEDLRISASTRLGRFVDIAPNGFTDQTLSVEQMIPLSGKNLTRARIAVAEAMSSLEELRRSELDVVLKIRSAYISLVSHHALLELLRANENSLVQTLDISRANFEVGDQSQSDVLAAEIELNRLGEPSHNLLRNISEDETQLKVLMNRDPFTAMGQPVDDLPQKAVFPEERLRNLLLANRPEIRVAQANVVAAKARAELAKREWIPDPTLSVQAQRYNEGSQVVSEVSGGISFSVPWFNKKKYRAGEDEAQAGVEAAQSNLEEAQIESLGLLRDQIQKIETIHHHVGLFHDQLLPKAHEAYETNRTGYESNKTSFLELVTSQRNERDLKSIYRQHLADYQTALAELEALVGADLHFFANGSEISKGKIK